MASLVISVLAIWLYPIVDTGIEMIYGVHTVLNTQHRRHSYYILNMLHHIPTHMLGAHCIVNTELNRYMMGVHDMMHTGLYRNDVYYIVNE